MLKFYLQTAGNIAIGMSAAFVLFIILRAALWLFGAVSVVIFIDKLPIVIGIIALGSLACSAVWTGAQWLRGGKFSN